MLARYLQNQFGYIEKYKKNKKLLGFFGKKVYISLNLKNIKNGKAIIESIHFKVQFIWIN